MLKKTKTIIWKPIELLKHFRFNNNLSQIIRRIFLPTSLIALLFLTSCMPGKKTARIFLEKSNQMAVMIVPPTNTFLYYYPFNSSQDPTLPVEGESIENSHFLNKVDINKANEIFMTSLLENLKKFDLNVFTPDQFDEFLTYEGVRYIFTIAQTEMVESDRQHTDRALIDTVLYRQDFLLRTIERNTWFEFVEVDKQQDEADMKVLYSTFFTADNVDGKFRYRALSGEVSYEYSSYLINFQDIYSLNNFAGQKNARYIFEFLLNRYVEENARSFIAKTPRFRYNKGKDELRRSRDDQNFIILEPQEVTVP